MSIHLNIILTIYSENQLISMIRAITLCAMDVREFHGLNIKFRKPTSAMFALSLKRPTPKNDDGIEDGRRTHVSRDDLHARAWKTL